MRLYAQLLANFLYKTLADLFFKLILTHVLRSLRTDAAHKTAPGNHQKAKLSFSTSKTSGLASNSRAQLAQLDKCGAFGESRLTVCRLIDCQVLPGPELGPQALPDLLFQVIPQISTHLPAFNTASAMPHRTRHHTRSPSKCKKTTAPVWFPPASGRPCTGVAASEETPPEEHFVQQLPVAQNRFGCWTKSANTKIPTSKTYWTTSVLKGLTATS